MPLCSARAYCSVLFAFNLGSYVFFYMDAEWFNRFAQRFFSRFPCTHWFMSLSQTTFSGSYEILLNFFSEKLLKNLEISCENMRNVMSTPLLGYSRPKNAEGKGDGVNSHNFCSLFVSSIVL